MAAQSSSPNTRRTVVFLCWCALITSTLAGMPRMPAFSWDTPPVFIHMCNATGPFNDSVLEYITKYPMVTVEKGQGINATTDMPYASYYAEQKILQACQSIKALKPDIICIFYFNTVLDWPMYEMHEKFILHPEYWLRDSTSQIVLLGGDHSFPQPAQGMLVPDYQQPLAGTFWGSVCTNMTLTYPGIIDGCFADRANENTFGHYNFTAAETQAITDGHIASMLGIQATLNDTNGSVLVANTYYKPGIVAIQIERFSADEDSIKMLMEYAQLGVLMQAHAGYTTDGKDNHCADITNSLAAFLIGAEKYSYYGCSRNWYIEPDWIVWHEQYDKPLGAPMGRAVKTGDVYARSFQSGTKVTFNVTSNVGTIAWASEV